MQKYYQNKGNQISTAGTGVSYKDSKTTNGGFSSAICGL